MVLDYLQVVMGVKSILIIENNLENILTMVIKTL